MEEPSKLAIHWGKIKSQLKPNVVLLVKIGGYYEAFFEDAQILATNFQLEVFTRNNIPVANFPLKEKDKKVNLLLRNKYSIAICDDFCKSDFDAKLKALT